MLQKILVVLVGIVMSVVGALSPAGLFASEHRGDIGGLATSGAIETPIATVRTIDGAGFAKVSILWAEVDGRRITDDAWGTGTVDELRFKVGVKDVDGLALSVGERLVPMTPTDVLTVRMFQGEFAFRHIGTPQATLQLQGNVKTATLSDGGADTRLRTEIPGTASPEIITPPEGGAREVAYVVLTTGEKLETVGVEDGGARLFTEEALDDTSAANAPGNLLAKWVRIDGKLLQEYTWGDGPVSSIEFEPADAGRGGVVLAHNGAPTEASAGTRVVINDFVGEYLVYQVQGGLVRLRLDGYAGDMTIGAAAAIPVQAGEGAPIAAFEFSPANPKTTDTVRFTDRSEDDTLVVLRLWRFGDEGTSVLPNPTHRFTTPGQYVVTLNVTDTDRQQSETSMVITVGNADPVPDFDFWPKIITTDTIVSFTDESIDTDGSIANHTWTFGDGSAPDYDRHPTHEFNTSGDITVTLTTRDNLGGVAKISKIIQVRNTPPLARFNYSPTDVQTLAPVQFQDQSEDSDGVIIARNWKFGDGANATGMAPVHVFPRPGLYTVSLTVTDNARDADTTTTQIFVRNRLPIVNFSWSPQGSPATAPVHFTSLATDPDGTILVHEWDFGDGTSALEQNPTHFFQRSGIYNVTLTVTDSTLERNSTTYQVAIANAIPKAAISVSPNPAFRGIEVTIADVSTDADGDAIVSRTWRIDSEPPVEDERILRRTFATSGDHTIVLTVVDSAGSVGTATATLSVVNRPPLLNNITVTPSFAVVDQPVKFNVTGADLDAQPGDPPITYAWTFSDGTTATGAEVTRIFGAPGRVTATVRATDAEGETSNPLVTVVNVDFAVPVAAFSWQPAPPAVPATDDAVTFTSTSTSLNGPITSHRWDFKDGTTADGAAVTHKFTRPGVHFVKLTVTDNRSRSSSIELPVAINGRPVANFEFAPGGIIPRDAPVTFTDRSSDVDGDDIVAWQWNFGDATTSNERHPTHNFTQPGAHNVTLTVTDARGASASTSKFVRIENQRPIARFDPPVGAVAGEPATFTDASSDPDGTPIAAWSWTFGDGGTSGAQNPQHTYAVSGRYLVALTVNDGELNSIAQPGAFHYVRIGADHPVGIDVSAMLPDGRAADLTSSAYTVRARVGQAATGFIDVPVVSPNGTNLRFELERGAWMRGDIVTVTLSAPAYFSGTLTNRWTLADFDGVSRLVQLNFEVPLPLVATVDTKPGTEGTFMTTPILVPNDERTSEQDPVYRSLAEAFHGTGTVKFADGTTVAGATVVLEARYLPIRAVGGIRDASSFADSSLLGWCRAATASTDIRGNYTWTMDHRSDCTFQELGVHPVGRWEIRARASYSFATSDESETHTVYVDPTGGLLWSVAAPP